MEKTCEKREKTVKKGNNSEQRILLNDFGKKERNLIDICTILEENVSQEMCRKRANYLVRSQRQH